jgi:nucleoid-associated protein YgaU
MNVRTNVKSGDACYTVQSGDSLSTISQKFYGNMNGNSVATIYYSNLATIGSNPNLIRPGQKLFIPTNPA